MAKAIENSFTKMRRDQLEEDYAAWEAAQPLLKKITIKDFQIQEDRFGTSLIATFVNDTDRAIRAIECRFVEKDPKREIPYTDDEVLFFFDGGIEPGETKEADTGSVYPTRNEGVERTLNPIKLLDADLKPIADGSMTKADAAELLELRNAE